MGVKDMDDFGLFIDHLLHQQASAALWLAKVAYWHGYLQGRQSSGEIDFMNSRILFLDWNYYGGRLTVSINDKDFNLGMLSIAGSRVNSFELIYRGGHDYYDPRKVDVVIDVSNSVTTMVKNVFPDITVQSEFRRCASGYENCKRAEWGDACKLVDGVYMCGDCRDEYERRARNAMYRAELNTTNPERLKMTQALRYFILKRDNFTCQLCGRTPADDGVKLEVDHIIPVSKGGKTIESNLRTLCYDCNRGKSDGD